MYRSVVRETRGYDATIDWLKGDSSRIGRARREARKRVEDGFWSSKDPWTAVA